MKYEANETNEMERLLGVKHRINKRIKKVDKTIKQLERDLARCEYKFDRTLYRARPGPVNEAAKIRAKRLDKEKRWYEGQRDMLDNQALKLDRLIFASEGMQDAQQTVSDLKEMKGMMNNLRGDMMGLIDGSNEILKSFAETHKVPDDDTVEEEDLMDDRFVADEVVYPYLQPKTEPDLHNELVAKLREKLASRGRY